MPQPRDNVEWLTWPRERMCLANRPLLKLSVTFCHYAGLQSFNTTIWMILNLVNIFTADWNFTVWQICQFPSVVSFQGSQLMIHCLAPTRVFDGLFISLRFNVRGNTSRKGWKEEEKNDMIMYYAKEKVYPRTMATCPRLEWRLWEKFDDNGNLANTEVHFDL